MANDSMKQQKIKEILGANKAHFSILIDQLIFMEDTHHQNNDK